MMRRLRAALTIGVLWALAWAPFGGLLFYLSLPPWDLIDVPRPLSVVLATVLRGAANWAVLGGLNGAIFAFVLSLAERRRALSSLTFRRVMLWGALGSLVLPTGFVFAGLLSFGFDVWSVAILPLAMMAAVGAGCAAGTLGVARRAPPALSGVAPGSLTST